MRCTCKVSHWEKMERQEGKSVKLMRRGKQGGEECEKHKKKSLEADRGVGPHGN